MASENEKEQDSFGRAVGVLKNRFSEPARDGPVKYAQFIREDGADATAFATVQEFLSGL